MSERITQELVSLTAHLSPELEDAMKRIAQATDEIIDDLAALEGISVYGRDCEILGEHLANLRVLRQLRDEFEERGNAIEPAASPQTS